MAFLAQDPNQQNQDPNNPQGQVAGAAGQGVTIGGTGSNTSGVLGGSGAGTVGANSSSGSANSPKGTSSGSFTNLQNYVTANQGNDAQMGQQVQGMVQGVAGQADQTGQQFQQGAQQQIDSQTVKEDPNMVGSLQKGDPSGVDRDAFAKQWNAGTAYTGPKDATGFDNYGNAQQSYKNVDTYGQEAAGDSSQHQQLLQDTYARNGQQYNQGESALDSFVLGSGQGGAQALNNINNQYGNYSQNFANIGNLVNRSVQNAQTTNQATAQDVQSAANTGYQALQNNLDTAAKQATNANTSASTLNQQLTGGNVAALKAQGLSDAAIQYIQQQNPKYNWSQIVNQSQGQHTAADYANANDIKNYQSLLSLVNGVAPGMLNQKYGADQLTASGATGPSLKAQDVQAANDVYGLNQSLHQALDSKQYQAAQQYANLQRDLGGFGMSGMQSANPAQVAALAKTLGVDSNDLMTLANGGLTGSDMAAAGLDSKGSLSQLLRAPGKFDLGDVATADQKAQYSKLSGLLGLNPSLTATPTKAVDLNKDAFQALVQRVKASQAQTATENAAANANGGTDSNNTSNSQPWYNINKYFGG